MGGVLKPALRKTNGLSLIENTLQNLGPHCGELVLVAPEATAQRLHARLGPDALQDQARLRWVHDPGEGPARALQRALEGLRSDALLLVGGDHPHPVWRLAERLRARQQAEGTAGAVVVREDRVQPLFSWLRAAPLRALSPFPRSLWRVISAMPCSKIPWETLSEQEQRALVDVDRAQEAQAEGLADEVR